MEVGDIGNKYAIILMNLECIIILIYSLHNHALNVFRDYLPKK